MALMQGDGMDLFGCHWQLAAGVGSSEDTGGQAARGKELAYRRLLWALMRMPVRAGVGRAGTMGALWPSVGLACAGMCLRC
jgi:hypothetical protein